MKVQSWPVWIAITSSAALGGCKAQPVAANANATTGGSDSAANDGAADANDAAASAADVATGPEVSSALLGQPCQPATSNTCGFGLGCFAPPGAPQGFCLRFCAAGLGCPPGSTCVPSGRAGELCLPQCSNSTTCPSGMKCSEDWKACALAEMRLAPKLPACPTAADKPAFANIAAASSATLFPNTLRFEPTAALLSDGGLVIAAAAATVHGFDADGKMVHEPNPMTALKISPTGQTESEVVVPAARQRNLDPWIALDRNKKLHLVWLGQDDGETAMEISYATSDDGLAWSLHPPVHDSQDCPASAKGCLDKPMIVAAADPQAPKQDVLHVLYAGSFGLSAVRSVDGGKSFSKAAPLKLGAYGDIASDAKGAVHVASVIWSATPASYFGDPAMSIVHSATVDGGKSWSAIHTVSAASEPIPFYFSNTQIAIDEPRKLVYVVYPRGLAGRWDLVLAVSKDAGNSWTRKVIAPSGDCLIHAIPSLVVDPQQGDLHLTWNDQAGVTGRVAWLRCASEAETCDTPHSVSATPFASMPLARWNPVWMGEYDALVLDHERRMLRMVWTQPDGKPLWSRLVYGDRKLP